MAVVCMGGFSLKPCNAQSWSAMDSGFYNASGLPYVSSIVEYDSTIYAASVCPIAGGVWIRNIAQWNENVWDSVPHGVIFTIIDMVEYNGNLVAGGNFVYYVDSVTVGSFLAQWNGTNWSTLGPDTSLFSKGPYRFSSGIFALAVYNGNLIAGGIVDSVPGTVVNNITYWDGTNWNALGVGLTGKSENNNPVSVDALVVYNGNLYVAGYFDSAGGRPARNIAMWNGTSWSAVGSGCDSTVSALAVFNGNLYAGGQFDSAGGNPANGISVWNGTSWRPVGGRLSLHGDIFALTPYKNYLYAGGTFDTIGGIAANNIAYWDGSNWNAMGTGFSITRLEGEAGVYTICCYNDVVYAGGTFDTAGGVSALNIAMSAIPTGINELAPGVGKCTVFPNPNNGKFTIQPIGTQHVVSASIEIYNVLGEKVKSEELRVKSIEIDLSSQPNGIYLYRVLGEKGELVGQGKVVVER